MAGPLNQKPSKMKSIIHFFEIVIVVVRITIMKDDSKRSLISSIRPLL